MENVQKRINLELVSNPKRAAKLISKTNFLDQMIFSKDLVAIHSAKTTIKYNKPIFVRQSVLDISKSLMYKFFYDKLKPKYGNRMNLLYTDTDSFILEINTDDFYVDIIEDLNE